ncbi:MAG: TetR/AcrR family transcriptional regulator [Aeromicrobium sp.]
MSDVEKVGLRDRKRQETRARLERAAVTLVLRDGLERTTVDAISELADVSPRTFFNYFDSKDSAILGLREIEIAPTTIASDGGVGLIEAVMRLLFAVMGAPLLSPTIREDRMEIVRRYPHILGGQLTHLTQMTSQTSDAVRALLTQYPQFGKQKPADLAASADLVLAICTGAIRVAVKEWADAGRKAKDAELEQRAISLVREVAGRLV